MPKIYKIKGKRVSKKQYMEQMKAIHSNNSQSKPRNNKMSSKTKTNYPQRNIQYKSKIKSNVIKTIQNEYNRQNEDYIKKVSQNLSGDWKDRQALLFNHADQLNIQYADLTKLESNPNISPTERKEITALKNKINKELTTPIESQLSIDKGKAREYRLNNIKLKPPEGTKINPDGSIEIIQHLAMKYEGDSGLKGSYRKSFVELNKQDKGREFSATYDFKLDMNDVKDNEFQKKLHDIDIRRGKTSDESKTKRASVTVRIDKSDEITLHNHPLQNAGSKSWNRPSGGDIANQIYFKSSTNYPNLKESYIVQPDGRFVRYKVTDIKKASEKYIEADREWDKKDKKPFGYFGGTDYAIEDKFSDMRRAEQRLGDQSHFDSKKAEKILKDKLDFFFEKDKKIQKQIERIQKVAKDDPKKVYTPTKKFIKESEVKIDKLLKKQGDLFDEYVKEEKAVYKKYPSRKNPKYIADKKKSESDQQYKDRRDVTVQRRTVTKWIKVMKSDWGVEVTRMPKNFKREF